MSILTIKSVSLSIVEQQLFDAVNLQVQERDKIALIGRNGEGKSTLLKLMAGLIMPDRGEITKSPQCKVALLKQQVPHAEQGKVFDIVVAGLGDIGDLLKRYNQSVLDGNQDALAGLTEKIEAQDGWSVSSRVNTIISKVGLKPEARIEDLSGGMKRRVMLAIALANEPDLLLLDEPTNHLDIASIEWLESFLQQYKGAFILVTHDRAFLSKVANRIVEIDRAQIHSYPGDYTNYLQRKEQRLQEEERHNALFDKRLSEEEKWIRQGIKARRTRNEGRVRALKEMRRLRQQRVEQRGVMSGISVASQESGKVVLEAQNISYAYEEQKVIDDFSLLLMRGDKVGIVGPNGCGKTTLLKLLLNQLKPSQGEIKFGTKLEVAYFDQLRSQLDENLTVLENVAEGRNEVMVNGKSKHVVSYLQDFLFSPQRINQPIGKLSGGERNRLLLAKLLTKEVNVLVMDEPTNDLDIEALEMLEAMLVDFKGTLLIVSHDRQFLNNVATSLLVFDGHNFEEHLGGYDDYLQAKPKATKKASVVTSAARKVTKKLSFNEQRELQQIPLKMEQLEQEVELLQEIMAEPSFYKKTQQEILEAQKQLDEKEQQLSECLERWEDLESRNA